MLFGETLIRRPFWISASFPSRSSPSELEIVRLGFSDGRVHPLTDCRPGLLDPKPVTSDSPAGPLTPTSPDHLPGRVAGIRLSHTSLGGIALTAEAPVPEPDAQPKEQRGSQTH